MGFKGPQYKHEKGIIVSKFPLLKRFNPLEILRFGLRRRAVALFQMGPVHLACVNFPVLTRPYCSWTVPVALFNNNADAVALYFGRIGPDKPYRTTLSK